MRQDSEILQSHVKLCKFQSSIHREKRGHPGH